jgi:glycosyltransferase involved in cell wall biosynthesis
LNHRVGIVVPTLGERPDYLEQCLRSIRSAGEAHILVVAPASLNTTLLQSAGLIDSVAIDEGSGLPSAINQGIKLLPASIEYVNWIGDDDLLFPGSLKVCTSGLDSKQDVVMTFGACEYIDSSGDVVWGNRSGQWAVPLLRFGPDLIPQPGALFRRSAFNAIGGLKTHLGWAFDFDLFIRLSKFGKLQFINQTLAQFRWHPESLSVEHRKRSVAEASQVRVSHLPSFLRAISFIWEYPVRQATLIAGKRVTAKAQSKARTK